MHRVLRIATRARRRQVFDLPRGFVGTTLRVLVQQLIDQVEAGRIPTVVVIAGSERFFLDRALRTLRHAVVGEGTPGFNEDIFEGKTAPAGRRHHLTDGA